MLTHDQIWTALDRLAERAGLSPSGLAKRSGLDPTTFNKSKRITADGRERWPSTESVAKALAATNVSIDTFVQLIDDSRARACSRCRCSASRRPAAAAISTMAAFRSARAGTRSACLSVNDEHAYALEISGDSMKPAYRDGDVIVVSPGTPIRRGDRVVVKTSDGEVMVKELKRRTAKTLELQSLNPVPCRPHARGRRRGMDRADRVGEPVSPLPPPSTAKRPLCQFVLVQLDSHARD